MSYVNVLICPEFDAKEGPVIKVKAVDRADGQEVNPKRDIISPYVGPDDIDEENIDAFFKKWLRRAFSEQPAKAGKILDFTYPAE